MEITYRDADFAARVLDAWVGAKNDKWAHPKLPLRVGRNLRKLNNELKEYRERQQALYKEHAKKDENGNPVTRKTVDSDGNEQDTGEPIFEDRAALNAALEAIADEVVSVEVHAIPESWFESDPCPSMLAYHADFLIDPEN